jgi:tryptophanyl-tRNA synthetase
MHTSYGNTIALRDTPEETTLKVMNMYTDPTRIHGNDPGHVEGNPVFEYHDAFNPNKEEVEEYKLRYRNGKIGDVELKRRLAHVINEYLMPIRQRRAEIIARPSDLMDILQAGTQAARPVAQATMETVKTKIGLNPAIQVS